MRPGCLRLQVCLWTRLSTGAGSLTAALSSAIFPPVTALPPRPIVRPIPVSEVNRKHSSRHDAAVPCIGVGSRTGRGPTKRGGPDAGDSCILSELELACGTRHLRKLDRELFGFLYQIEIQIGYGNVHVLFPDILHKGFPQI